MKKWLNGMDSYKSKMPTKVDPTKLSVREKFLLKDSKTFCTIPWTHLHAYPDGKAYPCCLAEHKFPIGSMKDNTIEELWNSPKQKQIRKNMLEEKKSAECRKCYEQESHGWTSMRQSSNIHFGHHVDKVKETREDGHYEDVNMIYWDIRFSNLCNLSCRSCGSMFSSNWYDDQTALFGKPNHDKITYAGTTKMDAYDQLLQHMPKVEQIYFAGGEPLIMEEHYKILKELIRLGKADTVRLIYNTNFTRMAYKDLNVLDIWPEFKQVSVGASLDAMGPRAEVVRNGTVWADVERNREEMLKKCPQVDFYISPTVSVMNVDHIPDFHRDWMSKGFLGASDLHMNILQDPDHYRIDILPETIKHQCKQKIEEHMSFIKSEDNLQRAYNGMQSVINFMMAEDKTHLLPQFVQITKQLDARRKQKLQDVAPELKEIFSG